MMETTVTTGARLGRLLSLFQLVLCTGFSPWRRLGALVVLVVAPLAVDFWVC